MKEQLIIYLHTHDLEHPSWAVLDDNTVRQSAFKDSAQGLAEIAKDKKVIVMVPAQDVLLTRATLPKMNHAKILKALPYTLEDKLIDELEALHFSYQKEPQSENDLSVAIVSHDKMQLWLKLLQTWMITPDLFISAVHSLPYDENSWPVLLTDIAFVRTGYFQGFACDKDNLAVLLNLAVIGNEKVKSIQVYNATDLKLDDAAITLDNTTITKQEEALPPAQCIATLAQHVNQGPYINLLHGMYAVKRSKLQGRNTLLKTAIGFACLWVVLLFLYPVISYYMLKHRVDIINQQIISIYKRHFPQASSFVAPKMRMQEKLHKMTTHVGENNFFTLLGQVAKALASPSQVKINRFDFQNNQLTLVLTANSSDDFSEFTALLQQQGLHVKQQNANLIGSEVNATLLIE